MNNLFWQFACVSLLFLCVMWNRAAWGDPKWPLLGLAIAIALWTFVALYALVTTFWGLYQGRVGDIAVLSVVLPLIVAMIPLAGVVLFLLKARQVPPIHDISTDTVNPPEFVLAKKARHSSHNSLVYAPSNAELQRQAYPYVNTLHVSLKPSELIVVAEKAVDTLGWKVYDIDSERGVIEAYATTSLLRFTDDIIIRIKPTSMDESRLDIRSVSRVGVSDLGANAARIQQFFDTLPLLLAAPVLDDVK